MQVLNAGPHPIRYVAIGDSYTIGEGAGKGESWPELLVKHLNDEGIPIELIANPSRTGWTSQTAIERELDIYDDSHPDFATLLIGVNDWVQGVDAITFRRNFVYLVDQMLLKLQNKHNLVVLTIPDFSATPTGRKYGDGRNISEGIAEFNAIIRQEAEKKHLTVVDLYTISKEMQDNHALIAKDGLHPSSKEYAKWEKLIFPVALKILK